MWSRFSLFAALLVLAACAEPVASDATTTEAAIAPSRDSALTADGRAMESKPADGDAASADAAEASGETTSGSTDEADGGSGIPMVEVNVDAAVEHADSGARTLTLRSGPSTRTEPLGTFSYGFVMECQDRTRADAWCRIRAEMSDREAVGWAKRRHLSYVGNIMEEAGGVRMFGDPGVWGSADGFPVDARWDILADDGYANVRAQPTADGALVRRLDNRTMTSVERCDGGAPGRRWCEISAPVRGWVHQSGFHRQLRSL